ncbi:hypothetical protein [Streptomyces sp. AGS-58]|uniref:hypothetical protein n=1 Tax=unclassified Streptomyces TaxID=2593676 RepID=UPI0035A35D45
MSRHAGALAAAATATLALAGTATASAGPVESATSFPRGHDVSSHRKRVDRPAARARGARFVYVVEAVHRQQPQAFAGSNPMWTARHGTARPGTLPGGWRHWTFRQYGTGGRLPGDQDLFDGSMSRPRTFARGR